MRRKILAFFPEEVRTSSIRVICNALSILNEMKRQTIHYRWSDRGSRNASLGLNASRRRIHWRLFQIWRQSPLGCIFLWVTIGTHLVKPSESGTLRDRPNGLQLAPTSNFNHIDFKNLTLKKHTLPVSNININTREIITQC